MGGAIGLAVVTAVISAASAASHAPAGSSRALLDTCQSGLIVSVIVALLGLIATLWGPVQERLPARIAFAGADRRR